MATLLDSDKGWGVILAAQATDGGLVPLENTILALTCASRSSGGPLVLIDQAAQYRFSADLARAGVGCVDAGSRAGTRDALADALMVCRSEIGFWL
jgi:hypothetical protein